MTCTLKLDEGGGGINNRFFQFSCEWEELLFQTKFSAVTLSFGQLSMKKNFRSGLGSKIR